MTQISDEDALSAAIADALAANPDKVAAYRGGKTGLLGFFMGQVMRATGGKANPQVVKKLLQAALADDEMH
jgi:Asp-tRNA(Asn)/Glu-tRNA(Gln) amidotransferase B subunit